MIQESALSWWRLYEEEKKAREELEETLEYTERTLTEERAKRQQIEAKYQAITRELKKQAVGKVVEREEMINRYPSNSSEVPLTPFEQIKEGLEEDIHFGISVGKVDEEGRIDLSFLGNIEENTTKEVIEREVVAGRTYKKVWDDDNISFTLEPIEAEFGKLVRERLDDESEAIEVDFGAGPIKVHHIMKDEHYILTNTTPHRRDEFWSNLTELAKDDKDEEWDEDRMDIIGQNGNTGDHYQIESGTKTAKEEFGIKKSCESCGIPLDRPVGYVCNNPDCKYTPKVTC